MKHIKIFESWHTTEVCPRCKGTGHVGMSKHQSIETILRKGTDKQFLDYIGDGDFIENAAELFKERPIFSIRIAKLVAALNLTREQIKPIIEKTEKEFDEVEDAFSELEKGDTPIFSSEQSRKMKDMIRDRSEILAILRGR
jgi:hypothetical protein